jgi:hypothetical protein
MQNNKSILKTVFELSVVVYTYNPSTQEAEAGGSQVQGQPGLGFLRPYLKKKTPKTRTTTTKICVFICLVISKKCSLYNIHWKSKISNYTI